MADDGGADEGGGPAETTVEEPGRPFEPWFEAYVAAMVKPGVLKPAGPLGVVCEATAGKIADELVAEANQDRWNRFTQKLAIMVFDAYWFDRDDEAWLEEETGGSLAGWLADRLDSQLITMPLGSMGVHCRDAAYELVSGLRASATPDSRTEFVRIFASLLYDSYIGGNWVEVPNTPFWWRAGERR
ncbi:hypothetical protein [Actinoplanes awajinensis]|uniref:Uncharacterized protein n=1 Tax=Actinoplanes awajinensis subsp. mycoplanecinus TaxID=135947 RepID=A0A124GA82_9ACTN|nr:hypothetical protein [Actinoplanes awajinensis]KUL31437.1 hypothetical protein ADL15_22135 [Actinoplanes awajinensis subsp. mycoplanecinus]